MYSRVTHPEAGACDSIGACEGGEVYIYLRKGESSKGSMYVQSSNYIGFLR